MKSILTLLLAVTWLASAGKGFPAPLIVGSELDFPPFALQNSQGEADGYSVDLIKAVAEVMGLAIKFRIGPWQEIRSALERGEIDLLPLVAYSKERDQVFDFTVPHTTFHDAIFIRRADASKFPLNPLNTKEVIVMQADFSHDYVTSIGIPKERIFFTKTNPEAMRLLASGQHDYVIMPKLMGLLIIKAFNLSNLQAFGGPIEAYQRDFCFAVTQGNAKLIALLNDGLSIIKATGKYDEIYKKWFDIVDPHGIPLAMVVRYVGMAVLLLLTFLGAAFAWSFSLKRQVAQRTYDLQQEILERQQAQAALQKAKELAEQAQQEADQANHAKSVFLATMSHELRTPLNGILGYAQILNADNSLTHHQHDSIRVIRRCGEYLLTLINDILDISKIEAGRVELYPVEFYLENFISEINELFKMRASQKGLTFLYESFSPLPVVIRADEKRLRQILLNLLSNAVKFTSQGQVTFKMGVVANNEAMTKIRFQVADTGIGIAEADLNKIFQPFQQVGDFKYYSEGTGLGLSLTHRLISLMGGQLWVESTLGKGSVFWTELEFHVVTERGTAQFSNKEIRGFTIPVNSPLCKRKTTLDGKLEKCKILVVDDIENNRAVLVNFLTPLGFEVIEANDGQEGVAKAYHCHPDLIFMDLRMPMMSGLEVLQQIRKIQELQTIPVIIVSASVFDKHRHDSLSAGCTDFIEKPVDKSMLLERLQTYLGIEWIYQEWGLPTEPAISLEGLSHQQAKILHELAEMGDVIGILKYLEELEKTVTPSFIEKIRQWTDELDTQKICKLIEPKLHS